MIPEKPEYHLNLTAADSEWARVTGAAFYRAFQKLDDENAGKSPFHNEFHEAE